MTALYVPVNATLRGLLVQIQQDFEYLDGLGEVGVSDVEHFQPVYNDLASLTDSILNGYADIPTTPIGYNVGRFDVSPDSQVAALLDATVYFMQTSLNGYVSNPPTGPGRAVVDSMLNVLKPLYAAVMQSVADTFAGDVQANAQDHPAAVLDAFNALADALN